MASIVPPPAVPAALDRPDDTPAALTQAILTTLVDIVSSVRCEGSGRLVKLGVSMTHLHVLWMLQHHGDLPMSRVADLLDASLSSATGIIDRMEERGLVERARAADDRRVVLVHLADGGRQALEDIEAVRLGRMTAILAHLDASQLACLAQALADIRSAILVDESLAHPMPTHPSA
jgi:DNA-binding MarR family transcriptional regulator